MSSICSKNDLAPVRDILTAHGVWDYFVVPDVSWGSKGARLKALIESATSRGGGETSACCAWKIMPTATTP
jgi:hypothetical protein